MMDYLPKQCYNLKVIIDLGRQCRGRYSCALAFSTHISYPNRFDARLRNRSWHVGQGGVAYES